MQYPPKRVSGPNRALRSALCLPAGKLYHPLQAVRCHPVVSRFHLPPVLLARPEVAPAAEANLVEAVQVATRLALAAAPVVAPLAQVVEVAQVVAIGPVASVARRVEPADVVVVAIETSSSRRRPPTQLLTLPCQRASS